MILFSQIAFGQNYVKGTMNPINNQFNWVVLYQLKGAKQVYIANSTLNNGAFNIAIPATAPAGMYRLTYKMDQKSQVDFIYNKQNVEVAFNPLKPVKSVKFLQSDENILYSNYLKTTNTLQQKIDSLQLAFLNEDVKLERTAIAKAYEKILAKYKDVQKEYDTKSNGFIANHFIKAGQVFYANHVLKTPQEFLNSKKQHYFDYINFEDKVLKNSIFITEKVIDYVFYMSVSDDVEVQNKLYEKAINELIAKTGSDNQLKSDFLTTILYNFNQQENAVLMKYVLGLYSNLPKEFQNGQVITETKSKLKLAIGNIAPDFTFKENGVTKKLSTFKTNAKNIILAFWSTTCSHCLHEIPLLHNFSKTLKNVHVIGFNMENDDLGFKKYAPMYPEWTNILGLKKWQNKVARMYEVRATPTYFILDRNKKIVAKPEHLKDLKAFFGH